MRRFGVAIGALHVSGLTLACTAGPEFAATAALAYVLGVRHAFDADHIAAIDNAGRKLRAAGVPAGGVGFWFALGHCTVVLGFCLLLVLGAHVSGWAPLGALVSGVFLCTIGLVNLATLVRGTAGPLERPLGRIRRAWHLYPVGFLFGLGFDTASQVGLLALSAGAGVTPVALLALPLLFAAGMTLTDGAGGGLAAFAAGSTSLTAVSVAMSLTLGTIQLARIPVDVALVGYASTALFAAAWLVQRVTAPAAAGG